MADRKPLVLKENHSALNRAALNWLKVAKALAEPEYLHLLNLAWWGLENEAAGEWPASDRAALKEQVSLLFGWKTGNTLAWLLTNPNGPSKDEQAASLHRLVETAADTMAASAHILNAIYSRQQSQNTALQPAASELSSNTPIPPGRQRCPGEQSGW